MCGGNKNRADEMEKSLSAAYSMELLYLGPKSQIADHEVEGTLEFCSAYTVDIQYCDYLGDKGKIVTIQVVRNNAGSALWRSLLSPKLDSSNSR